MALSSWIGLEMAVFPDLALLWSVLEYSSMNY
jgi:hypothetical protein